MSSPSLEEYQIRARAELELRQRRQRLLHYANDPIGFIEKELGEWLTEEQRAIANSVRDIRETNVQAAHGVGKSFLASRLAVWWIFCCGGLVITTAPTRRQVEKILWSNIRQLHQKLKLPGTLGQTFLNVTEAARGFGFTATPTSANAFQGIHHDRLLVIEDEACGISEEIDNGASSCATGAHNRMLRIGNPVTTNTPFQRVCAKRHIRIPVWSHPNVAWAYEAHADGIHRLKPEVAIAILDEEGEVKEQSAWPDWCPRDQIDGAISIAWVEDVRQKKGERSAYWQSRVEGLFALDSEASIVARSSFLAARARYDKDPAYWDELAARSEWRHGLDVGNGNDDHALSGWRGPVLYSIEKMATQGDDEDVSRAAQWGYKALRDRPGTIGVDKIGVGSGTLSELRGKLENDRDDPDKAFGVNFGAGPTEKADNYDESFIPDLYKAELYWSLREALRKGEVAIAPLGEYEDELMDDLAGTYYEETNSGKTRIEDKKKTRKRLHRSPDCGDAVIYGWAPKPELGVWGVSEAGWGY